MSLKEGNESRKMTILNYREIKLYKMIREMDEVDGDYLEFTNWWPGERKEVDIEQNHEGLKT